mgnify:CR=1 FL=1
MEDFSYGGRVKNTEEKILIVIYTKTMDNDFYLVLY